MRTLDCKHFSFSRVEMIFRRAQFSRVSAEDVFTLALFSYSTGECTCDSCQDDGFHWFGREFACVDPSATCVDDDDITIEMIGACFVRVIGDGYCDSDNNNAICGECFGAPLSLFVLRFCANPTPPHGRYLDTH